MIESPFLTISRVLGEPVNGFDDLRIIARDSRSLSATERGLIEAAADELEFSQRAHMATLAQLLEAQQRLIAVNDRLIAATADLMAERIKNAPKVAWSISSGWLKVTQ